jgi:putative ABC transport system permease protein
VGAQIRLNDHAFTIIGVLPPAFRGMATGTDVWTPMAVAPVVYDMPRRLSNANAMWHQVMGRLHPDATVTGAAAELASLRAEIEQRYPSPTRQPLDLRIRSLLDVTIEPSLRRSIWILFGAVGCVLLITAANLSNLLLTRATVYRRQLAIRRALGASRAALARVSIAEALLLATFGGALGMLLAIWGIDLLTSLRPEGLSGFWKDYARVVDADTVDVTAVVFAFNFGAALLTGLVFSLLPALQATRIEIADTLRGGAGVDVLRGGPGADRQRQ